MREKREIQGNRQKEVRWAKRQRKEGKIMDKRRKAIIARVSDGRAIWAEKSPFSFVI